MVRQTGGRIQLAAAAGSCGRQDAAGLHTPHTRLGQIYVSKLLDECGILKNKGWSIKFLIVFILLFSIKNHYFVQN